MRVPLFWKFFLSSIIIIVAFSLFISATMNIVLEGLLADETIKYQTNCLKKIDSDFTYTCDKIVHLVNNMSLPGELTDFEHLSSFKKYEISGDVTKQLNDMMVYSNIIGASLIVNGRTFVSGQYFSDKSLLDEDNWPEDFALYPKQGTSENSYMILLKKVKLINNQFGLMAVQIDPAFLSERPEGFGVFVLNGGGELIWEKNTPTEQLNTFINYRKSHKSIPHDSDISLDDNCRFITLKMSIADAEFVMCMENSLFSKNKHKVLEYLIITTLAVIGLCAGLSLLMSRIITTRINLLSDRMRNYKLHTRIDETKKTGIGLKKKIILFYIVVCAVPTMIMFLMYYTLSLNLLKKEIVRSFEQSITYVRSNVLMTMDKYRVDGQYIANDAYIQKLLSEWKSGEDNRIEYEKICRIIKKAASDYGCENIMLYGRDGEFVFSLKQGVKSNIDNTNTEARITEPHYDEYNQRVLSVMMPIKGNNYNNSDYMQHIGDLIIDFKESVFKDAVSVNNNDSAKAFIVNKDDMIIASQNAADVGKNINTFISGSKNVCSYEIDNFRRVFGVLDSDLLKNRNSMVSLYFLLLIMITVIILLIVSNQIAAIIITPVNMLNNTIQSNIKSGKRVKSELRTGDEIEELCKSFNSMNEEIDRLIEEVYEAELAKSDKDRRIKSASLNALQAQINPHFLYNTFDSIKWLILQEKNDEAARMITDLSGLFRIGINRGENTHSIQNEVKHAQLYTDIQKIRYSDRLTVMWEYDDFVQACIVPKTILQPILENAIIHGIDHKPEGGEIEISIEKNKDRIDIHVLDSGVGIAPEKLRAINDDLINDQNSVLKNIGLKNVNDRIKLLYGEEYGVTVESVLGRYTEVIIRLPYTERGEANA